MTPLVITPEIVGRRVSSPNRPDWGVGTVTRVQVAGTASAGQYRVTVQFPMGQRVLLAPPAELIDPQPEVERATGWLDSLAGRTLDDRLTKLPTAIEEFFGTPAQKIRVLAALYSIDPSDPKALAKWARQQTRAADPLSVWSRDELQAAFERYCTERDSTLRVAAARLRQKEGPDAVEAALREFEPPVAEAMRAALRRII